MTTKANLFFVLAPFVLGIAAASCGGGDNPGMPDTGAGDGDGGTIDAGPCDDDLDCVGSYCNMGSHACCVPATPPFELCGDRIDQNCDRRDESCGDNDLDGVQACTAGEDPLAGCDCDDEHASVRPAGPGVLSAP